ncbi:MAG: hypothetical protein AB7P02_20715 [Alphaproteobacteria bacterium]
MFLLFGGLLALLLKPDARLVWAVRLAIAVGTLGIVWLAWHLAMGHDDASAGAGIHVDLAVLVIALAVALLGIVLAIHRR